jgi:hypothetical protein
MAVVFALMLSGMAVISADNPHTFGAAGGTMSFADGAVSVDVPQGALSADVSITYTALSGDAVPAAAPAGTSFGSNVFSLAVEPATTFGRPVTITIAYGAADVTAGGANYNNVKLYVYDVAFNEWQVLESAIRDIAGLTLATQQTSIALSYALIVPGAEVPPAAATPEATPPPAETPETGDLTPGNGLLLGLAAAGLLLVLGGGYIFLRRPSAGRA